MDTTSPPPLDDHDPTTSGNTSPGSEYFEDFQPQLPSQSLPFAVWDKKGPARYHQEMSQNGESSTYSGYEAHGSETSTSPSTSFTGLTSASPGAGTWGSPGIMDGDEHGPDMDCCRDADGEILLVPKIEEMDEDVGMEFLKDVATLNSPIQHPESAPKQLKRPRGRPRKHPKPTPESQAKVTKGRSKTGCLTCRKRKKKCDEAKPRCRYISVLSTSYDNVVSLLSFRRHELREECRCLRRLPSTDDMEEWQGKGRGRYEDTCYGPESPLLICLTVKVQIRRASLPQINLKPVINGVETTADRIFFEHYVYRLSSVFTVEDSQQNAFKHMLLPMAVEHIGLMHSILALSSRHINYKLPYGRSLLEKHPDVDEASLLARSQYHHDEAIKKFNEDIALQDQGRTDSSVLNARYGQMLCLVLETLMDGDSNGTHRVHLQGYQRLMQESPPEDGPFLQFIQEFFQYHICADELISLPQDRSRLGGLSENFMLPRSMIQPDAVRLLGVQDGLFFHMSKITNMRNVIRDRMERGIVPAVGYESLYLAAEIDAGIREWTPPWQPGDQRDLAGLLYQHMMWVYLYRTLYPPRSSQWGLDTKISDAVDDGLKILAQFGPNDPSQTLLLVPTFIIGCAAFKPEQRDPIRKSIATIKEYTGMANSDRYMQVLEEVWKLMDEKSEKSWDWQRVAHSIGVFLSNTSSSLDYGH